MSVARYRWGPASWVDIGNGKASSRWGGGWFPIRLIRGKVGAVGGGSWQDAGYTGLPGNPSGLYVYAWDYSNVVLKWTAASGGAPVTKYIVNVMNADQTLYTTVDVGNATSLTFGVNPDWRYAFEVYAQTSQGVNSGVTNRVRIQIGHAAVDNYGNIGQSAAWESEHQWNFRGANDPYQVRIGTDVHIESVHWRNLCLDGSTIVQIAGSGASARWCAWYFSDTWQDGPNAGVAPTPARAVIGGAQINRTDYINYDVGFDSWGDGKMWGMGPRGAGWSPTGGDTNWLLWADGFWFNGTRYWTVWGITSTTPAVGNTYW